MNGHADTPARVGSASLHVLQGGPALSPFRTAALLARVQAMAPQLRIRSVTTLHIYCLALREPAPPDIWPRIRALLDAGVTLGLVPPDGIFVMPRKGTHSPWASKAGDIFRNCGLNAVERVEHGLWYRFTTDSGTPLSASELHPLARLLHDRMTQGLYQDLSDFFAHAPPAPLTEINVLGRGLEALQAANTAYGLALDKTHIREG